MNSIIKAQEHHQHVRLAGKLSFRQIAISPPAQQNMKLEIVDLFLVNFDPEKYKAQERFHVK